MGMFGKWMVGNISACVEVGVKHISFRLRLLGSIWDPMSPWGIQGGGLLRNRAWRHQFAFPQFRGPVVQTGDLVLSKSWFPRHVSFVHSQRFLVLFSWDCLDLYLVYLWAGTKSILWNSLILYLTITSVSWATVTFSEWLDCWTRKMLHRKGGIWTRS